MTTIRVALAQLPVAVGDFAGNSDRVTQAMGWAEQVGADLLLTPEMVVSGYPAEDLLANPDFVDAAEHAVKAIAGRAAQTVSVIGAPARTTDLPTPGGARSAHAGALDAAPRQLRNAAILAQHGRIVGAHAKTLLPTYSVFDDARFFEPGPAGAPLFNIAGVDVAILVCEDVWADALADAAAAAGAQLIAVINASPFCVGKPAERERLVRDTARRTGCAVAYVNTVGGQDEVVFDGASMVADQAGRLVARGAFFAPDRIVVDVEVRPTSTAPDRVVRLVPRSGARAELPTPAVAPIPPVREQVYVAAVVGLRSYFARTGFTDAILGLSGGVDSALVATMACDALGAGHVWGIGMPGPFSSGGSVRDARQLADNLGMSFDVVDITAGYHERLAAIGPLVNADRTLATAETPGTKVARENLQARLRATTLMTLANAHNALLLTTGNKSEASCGFYTIGGDGIGTAPNPIGDVFKTTVVYRDGLELPGVFDLCRWRNEQALAAGEVPPIPAATLTKPPSAELSADQVDTDSLPPYPILDAVLLGHLEEHRRPDELVAMLVGEHGVDLVDAHAIVSRVLRLVELSEWKRHQAVLRIKLTRLAFGKDRRIPICNAFRQAPTPLPEPAPALS